MVTEGKPFSEAVREVGMFPKYVGDMIETGEETGAVGAVLSGTGRLLRQAAAVDVADSQTHCCIRLY